MSRMRLPLLLALSATAGCQGALNIGSSATDDLVKQLRQSIFVETAYLAERQEERCSSLDGPRCFQVLAGSLEAPPLDGPGVLPERLLHDLGMKDGGDAEFTLPDYDSLEWWRRQHAAAAGALGLPAPAGPEAAAALRQARNASERGILHFSGLVPDRRVPLSFSQGLPGRVVATWDGRWLVRDCSAGVPSSATQLALPAPDEAAAPMLVARPQMPAVGRGMASFVAAELTGSLGYLRFSQPVVARSLFARWQLRPKGAPPAVIGARLGLQEVWTVHLDPMELPRDTQSEGWLDVSGNRLLPIDEVVFIGTPGLEVGAVDVVVHDDDTGVEGSERSVLLLEPASPAHLNPVPGMDEAGGQVQLSLRSGKIGAAVSPYVVTLQEVIDRNLRLRPNPEASLHAAVPSPGSHVPGLLTAGSQHSPTDVASLKLLTVAATNQEMFEHRLIARLLAGDGLPTAPGAEKAEALARRLGAPPHALPSDLRRQLSREREAVLEAVVAWIGGGDFAASPTGRGGGWQQNTPLSLPRNGTEEAVQMYTTTKRWQAKLDLLTAAFLHAQWGESWR